MFQSLHLGYYNYTACASQLCHRHTDTTSASQKFAKDNHAVCQCSNHTLIHQSLIYKNFT